MENVLVFDNGTCKLCDFGSATRMTFHPTSQREIMYVEEDINHHTTPAYRAPEMLDLYRGKPITEKVDIWVRIKAVCLFQDLRRLI